MSEINIDHCLDRNELDVAQSAYESERSFVRRVTGGVFAGVIALGLTCYAAELAIDARDSSVNESIADEGLSSTSNRFRSTEQSEEFFLKQARTPREIAHPIANAATLSVTAACADSDGQFVPRFQASGALVQNSDSIFYVVTGPDIIDHAKVDEKECVIDVEYALGGLKDEYPNERMVFEPENFEPFLGASDDLGPRAAQVPEGIRENISLQSESGLITPLQVPMIESDGFGVLPELVRSDEGVIIMRRRGSAGPKYSDGNVVGHGVMIDGEFGEVRSMRAVDELCDDLIGSPILSMSKLPNVTKDVFGLVQTIVGVSVSDDCGYYGTSTLYRPKTGYEE